MPNLAITDASQGVPIPLCVIYLPEDMTISDAGGTYVCNGTTGNFTVSVDGNLRSSDPANVVLRATGFPGSVVRLWFIPPTSQPFMFVFSITVGGTMYFPASSQTFATSAPDSDELWSYSTGVQLIVPPVQPGFFPAPAGLPWSTDTNGITWYLSAVYPQSDPTTTIDVVTSDGSTTTTVCVAASFQVQGGVSFTVTDEFVPKTYEVDIWEVETGSVSGSDLYVQQTPSDPTSSNVLGLATITVYVDQAVACDRSGGCYIKAFVSVRDGVDRTVTLPLIVAMIANPTPILRLPSGMTEVSSSVLSGRMPGTSGTSGSGSNTVGLLEGGWDVSGTASEKPLTGYDTLGFDLSLVTTAVLQPHLTSNLPSLISSFDSSMISSGESSSALALSWSNLNLDVPGWYFSSTDRWESSTTFQFLFGLVYTNFNSVTVDRFPFPVFGIQLHEFARSFPLVPGTGDGALSLTFPVNFHLEQPLASGPGDLSGVSSLGVAGWPTPGMDSSFSVSSGSGAGFYAAPDTSSPSDGVYPLWIGVTNSNLSRLTLSWEVAGGFTPLTVYVNTEHNPYELGADGSALNVTATCSGAMTAPQATTIQGMDVSGSIMLGGDSSANIWTSTSASVVSDESGITTIVVGGLTWPAETDLTNLTSVGGGQTAFVPIIIQLTVTDVLGETHLFGKAYLRVFADEVPYTDGRLLNGHYDITFLNVGSQYTFSDTPADNVVVPYSRLVCGGVWTSPGDVGLTLTLATSSSSSTGSYALVSDGFQISDDGNLVASNDIQAGRGNATLAWADLTGQSQSTVVQLTYSATWTPTQIVFEALFAGSEPSSFIDTSTNTLLMFPDGSGNYMWPVSDLWTYPGLSDLTWSNPYVDGRDVANTFPSSNVFRTPPHDVFVFQSFFSDTWALTPADGFLFRPADHILTSVYTIPAFLNTVRSTLTMKVGGSDALISGAPVSMSTGEIELSAFAPLGGETNTWVYDPTGCLHVPGNVDETTTIQLVVVDGNADATSSTPTLDYGVGFYDNTSTFIGASITVTWGGSNWVYTAGVGSPSNLNTLVAIAFAPFGSSQPAYTATTSVQYLMRMFASTYAPASTYALTRSFDGARSVSSLLGGAGGITWDNLTVDPRTSSPEELFQPSAFAVTGFNTAGIFGYEMGLNLPLSTLATLTLSSGAGSMGATPLANAFQRFAAAPSSFVGLPSEAFQCPDSVSFFLTPDPFLTEVDGFLAYSLETSWDGGSTWYILAQSGHRDQRGFGRTVARAFRHN